MGSIAEFLIQHPGAAVAAGFAAAFCESLVVLSFVFPGSSLLFAAGVIIAATPLPLEGVLAGAMFGAVMGQACSFWLGQLAQNSPNGPWPMNRHPGLLSEARSLYDTCGAMGLFAARFLPPLRAVVPFFAGWYGMTSGLFWVANIASAAIWTPAVILSGVVTFLIAKMILA